MRIAAMDRLDIAEQTAISFMEQHGLRCERFNAAELRKGKTPDFRVWKGADLVLYCEAKHIQHDEWLDRQLDNVQPPKLAGGARPDPVFNRLTDRIHEAAKQFNAVNADRFLPNVLVFTNSDDQCGFFDLIAVLTGNFYAEGGAVEPIYKQYSEGRIKEEKFRIDLYVWYNEWKCDSVKPQMYFNSGSQHYVAICNLLGSDPAQHHRVP
jgi:hypothetical protein